MKRKIMNKNSWGKPKFELSRITQENSIDITTKESHERSYFDPTKQEFKEEDHLSDDQIKKVEISNHIRGILKLLDQDMNDPDLQGTPDRVARYYMEFLNYDPGNIETMFQSIQVDQMIVVKNISAWSLCAHHMLPIKLNISVGYLSGEKILGLSEISRLVQKVCHKLQVQERITDEIAHELYDLLGDPVGVGVMAEGEHTCMQMRGIESEGQMVTSMLLGVFRDTLEVKQEFLAMIK